MNAATPLLTFFLCIASLGAHAQTSGCATQPISLPSGASASAYQWQIQDTGTWENLDDTGEYSGTETSTLSIDPVELDMDGAGYRCLVPSAASATPDSVAFETVLSVLDPLAPAVIAFDEGSESANHCFGDNVIGLVQVVPASGSEGGLESSWQILNAGVWDDADEDDLLSWVLQDLTGDVSVRQISTSDGACGGTVYSNVLNIDVLEPIVAPSVMLSADTVCFGGSFSVEANVGDNLLDEVSLGWYTSINDTGLALDPSLEETSWNVLSAEGDYDTYLALTSLYGCGEASSDVVHVEVLEPLMEASIAFDNFDGTPLCFGDEAPMVLTTVPVAGADGAWTNTWQASINGANWNNAQINGTTFLPGTSTQDFFVRLQSDSDFGCGQVLSNVLEMPVWDDLQAPEVALVNADDAICFNTSPGPLEVSILPSGGSNVWTYQWQVNPDSWTDIPSGQGASFAPANLTADAAYRVVATDSHCGSVESGEVAIQVFAPLSPSMTVVTDNNDPLCADNEGVNVDLQDIPTGGGDLFTYAWQQNGETLAGELATDLQIGQLDSTSTFVLVASSVEGCGDVLSNGLEFVVYEPLTIGGVSPDQTICYDTAPAPITCEGANGASGVYSFQWELDLEPQWLGIPGETSTSISLVSLLVSASVRLSATDNAGCGSVTSDVVNIQVLEDWVPGSIEASTEELCFGDGFNISTDGPSGADNEFTSVWYVALNGGAYSQVDSLSTLNWSVSNASQDYDVYLESTSNFGCGTLATDPVHVEVLDSISAPLVSFANYNGINLCFGDDAPEVDVVSPAVGADGEWEYQWQQSGTSENWQDVLDGNEPFFAGVMTDSTLVRILGTSTFGCGTFASNEVLIPVWAEVVPGVINAAAEQTICYNTATPLLEASPAMGGGGNFNLQWLTESGTETVPFAQTPTLSPGALTDTSNYVLQYTNTNGCGTVLSNQVQFNVLPDLQTGSVQGWDGLTLCYNDPITLTLEGVDDHPWLSHQWFQSNASGVEELVAFESLTASNHPVAESSQFYVLTTSNFGCGSVESLPLQVDVWANLEPPTIDHLAGFDGMTLCFLDSAPDFTTIGLASGGGGPLVYEWESQVGLSNPYQSSGSDNLALYNPGTLPDTARVRLRVTDLYGCGTRVSNALQVNVFANLDMATQPTNTPSCYGSFPDAFTGVPTGGGDQYSLQWFSSEVNADFTPVSGQVNSTLDNLSLIQDTWFFLNVVSDLGCGTIQSDTALAFVLEPLAPGAIELTFNPICAEDPANLTSSAPQGGFESFEYTWNQTGADGWLELSEGNASFTSDMLFENTSFYASYTDACGTVYSDTVEVTVNPLPVIEPIVGVASPCYGSVNQSYRIPNWNYTWTYAWSVEEELGEITSGESVDEVLVNWFDVPTSTSVDVVVTNPTTACTELFSFPVTITDVMAPPPSLVVKKPGINILVSADSTACAQHRWGRESIDTGYLTYFNNLTEQYAFFETLDTLQYHYFVEVTYDCGDGPSCPTVNYYNHSPYVGVEEVNAFQLKVFPNPVQDRLSFESNQHVTRVLLRNSAGQIVQDWQGIGSTLSSFDVGHLFPGMYLVEFVSHRHHRLFQRIVVQ